MTKKRESPLKPKAFYTLVALAERERHGLDIKREVLRLSDGRVRLWPVGLYGMLADLVESKLIEELTGPARHPKGESEQRRYYKITRRGRDVLSRETERLAELVEVSRRHNAASSRRGTS